MKRRYEESFIAKKNPLDMSPEGVNKEREQYDLFLKENGRFESSKIDIAPY